MRLQQALFLITGFVSNLLSNSEVTTGHCFSNLLSNSEVTTGFVSQICYLTVRLQQGLFL